MRTDRDSVDTEYPPGLLEPFRWTDEEGRTDHALKWASLPLSLAFIAVYVLCFAGLNAPLNTLTARLPPWLAAVLCALLPSLLGTALCAVSWPMFPRERRMMAAAYRRVFTLGFLGFTAMQLLLWGDWDAQLLIVRFFASYLLPPVLLGGGLAAFLYRRDWWWKDEDEEA